MRALRLCAVAAALALAACGTPGSELSIVAGSENKPFEPLVQRYRTAHDLHCTFMYEGSLEIGVRKARVVPIFGVTFGDADRSQLDRVATGTGGRVFDGRANLAEAFQAARGYI